MLFSAIARFEKRNKADVCVIPFWKKGSAPKAACVLGELESILKHPLEAGDFTGKEGELLLSYLPKNKESRALLVGLGDEEKITVDGLRRAFGEVSRYCQKRGWSKVNLAVPTLSKLHNISADDCLRGLAEGILLSNYRFHVKSKPEERFSLIKSVELIGILPKHLAQIEKYEKVAASVYFARDLINGNADLITPVFLAQAAKSLADSSHQLKLTLFDRSKLEKEGLNLLLAVSKGSSYDPYLALLRYEGNPRSKDHTVFIGKGITFDTGVST